MSTRKKPRNVVYRLFRRIGRSFYTVITALVNSVLRGLMVQKRRRLRQSQAGFVLPTVVMVLLVVALLTTAIVIRSFDRAKNASNIRVDQAVLNAATPALDRARAKLEYLFSPQENALSGNPPPEGSSYSDVGTISYALSLPRYTFKDETQLKVVVETNGQAGFQNADQMKTSWKFPVDTDNDGKFDTFTLYGIYFRNPTANRARTPLEARALPQATGAGGVCENNSGNAASSFQQQQGWFEIDGQLKKAFFTYVANVPITQADINLLPQNEQDKYKEYRGNQSFSGLEMQQDQGRIALDNNAVWYRDDLVISNVPDLNLNGRIHTNSNLMVANNDGDVITLWQVSSKESCFYTAENAKIIVGGHVAAGDITGDTLGNATDSSDNLVAIHLYSDPDDNTSSPDDAAHLKYVNSQNKTTTLNPAQIATNSSAYDARLNLLVNAALKKFNQQYPTGLVNDTNVGAMAGTYPPEVIDSFKGKYSPTDPGAGGSILTQILKTYFAERIRFVSFNEVPITANPLNKTPTDAQPLNVDTVFAASGVIAPPIEWMRFDISDPAILPVNATGGGIELEATNPDDLGTGSAQLEYNIGDRIQVGNSLPRRWLKADNTTYAQSTDKQDIPNAFWLDEDGNITTTQRYRKGLVQQLDDLGDTSRGGYWERAAALSGKEFEDPSTKELAGGLRVVTGAGIYIDGNPKGSTGTGVRGVDSFLPTPPAKNAWELKQMAANDPQGIKLPPDIQNETSQAVLEKRLVVWPDTMPMFDGVDINNDGQYDTSPRPPRRGDLQMRATVVYHYADDPTAGAQQAPIACIATFYDPTNIFTAQNISSLPRNPNQANTTLGTSLNGINYPVPAVSARTSALSNTRLLTQANMLFPDGRWVNEPLRKAVIKLNAQGINGLSVADIAAIDAANCALGILDAPTSALSSGDVPNFAIQEQAFLDARQVKALRKRDTKVQSNATVATLQEVAADGTFTNVTRATTRQYISDPDKLKIAELGELSLPTTSADYSLPLEQRQPMEIRVTQIDLNVLRDTKFKEGTGTGINDKDEYLLPNSGIIYASRDDALLDISDFEPTSGADKGSSATDFKLDPTRRPNGILLVKGENLARTSDYRIAEKGLILATDLPLYIKGSFNRHFKPGTTTVREEFTDLLQDDYSNFYNRTDSLKHFACRPNPDNPQACIDGGDQWRAARILSDAVTLLSSNFRFGYRNEGDFDLNNNVGNLAVESRLKNGFWWNSFATSADWYDPATGYPKVDFVADTLSNPPDFISAGSQTGSTYVTNGVTPIQRRANLPQGFTEYKMEICRKLPVSACGPGDWKLEIPGDNVFNSGTGSGTTAPISDTPTDPRYVAPADRRYPRRVAFKRNSFGELEMPNCSATTLADCKAIPIAALPTAVSGSTRADVPYTGMNTTGLTNPVTTTLPTAVPNALWYLTTGDPTNANPSAPSPVVPSSTDIAAFASPPTVSYNNTNRLYYAPFEPEAISERQLILPGLLEFPRVMNISSLNSTIATASTNLTSAPSDYSVFGVTTGAGCATSQDYKPVVGAPAACPADAATAMSAIGDTWAKLLNYSQATNDSVVYVDDTKLRTLFPGLPNSQSVELKAEAKVNIYTLPDNDYLSGVNITLDRNNRIDDPIFVFRSRAGRSNLDIYHRVALTLKGVDPNNIFWVVLGNLGIRVDPGPNQHQLAGNFINGANTAIAFNNIEGSAAFSGTLTEPVIKGGRILGFSTPSAGLPNGVMTAMTTTSEPLLIPVLNIHSPQGTPAATAATAFGGNSINERYWVQHVPSSVTETYNAVLIMGDSPLRPLAGLTGIDSGEGGGGLANFPRFLEAWQNTGGPDSDATKSSTKIRGSFIQFKRSVFATAPFEAIDNPQQDNSLFFDTPTGGTLPAYMASFTDANNPRIRPSPRPYIYKGGAQFRKAPYYRAPNRYWGYDVGLLSQTPDLFARRFSTPSAGIPNEYFREVGRGDRWIQELLCAAEQTAGTTYGKWAIADPKQRPSSCQDQAPSPAKYDDPTT